MACRSIFRLLTTFRSLAMESTSWWMAGLRMADSSLPSRRRHSTAGRVVSFPMARRGENPRLVSGLRPTPLDIDNLLIVLSARVPAPWGDVGGGLGRVRSVPGVWAHRTGRND